GQAGVADRAGRFRVRPGWSGTGLQAEGADAEIDALAVGIVGVGAVVDGLVDAAIDEMDRTAVGVRYIGGQADVVAIEQVGEFLHRGRVARGLVGQRRHRKADRLVRGPVVVTVAHRDIGAGD